MDTIVIHPKNKADLEFLTEFLKRSKIKSKIVKAPAQKMSKRKKEILDGIEQGYREAQLHAAGKLKLPTLEQFLNEL